MGEYGRYITVAGNSLMVRVPGDMQRNYPLSEARKAVAVRNAIAKRLGIPLSGATRRECRIKAANSSKRDRALPSGVSYSERDSSFRVIWREGPRGDRVSKSKNFSLVAYGSNGRARAAAIAWRKKMELLHYSY